MITQDYQHRIDDLLLLLEQKNDLIRQLNNEICTLLYEDCNPDY